MKTSLQCYLLSAHMFGKKDFEVAMATMGPYGLPGFTHHEQHKQEARV